MQENAFNIHLDEDKMFGWGEVPLRFGLGQESISKTNSKLFKISILNQNGTINLIQISWG